MAVTENLAKGVISSVRSPACPMSMTAKSSTPATTRMTTQMFLGISGRD